ncbi:MAG TPA: protein phosphatase CheZ [Alicycliphilus sp.]|jgi:chemotaxis protein CheZ|nr:protein phosphatase CheZ [Alicycliphilus sp.]
MEVADQGLATGAGAGASTGTDDVHQKIGSLTRQLHTALNELGFADPLRGSMGELPDAQSRLSYIARLTGEAAEKVLGRVEQAKAQHDYIASETRRMVTSLVADPVAAVARGEIYNFLTDVERVTQEADGHLTEIMMAQDFHDLTGQVIARVVNLASTIEQQLVQLLLQTAPAGSAPAPTTPVRSEALQGPVVDAESRTDVVTDQSQVDDLLASLGF